MDQRIAVTGNAGLFHLDSVLHPEADILNL